METKKNILIVAGEASGDLHAAELVASLRARDSRLSFWGMGGQRLKNQGVSVSCDLTKLAVVGFWEVLRHLTTFRRVFAEILRKADEKKPDLAILVDYPGFNLRLAQQLHRRGIPIAYYISPQIWAWGKNRVRLIKQTVSRMLVLFAFEEELYRAAAVPVAWVGHPLLDVVKPRRVREEFLRQVKLDPVKLTVALLPGSREREVRSLLPVLLESCRILNQYFLGRIQFVLLAAETLAPETLAPARLASDLPLAVVSDATYDGIAASDFCLVCSGTATLETGILGVPMAVVYKVNFLTWALVRVSIRIPYIGLINVVHGKKVVEEFVQFDCTPEKICDYCLPLLQDADKRARIQRELSATRKLLGESGASGRAASVILKMLSEKKNAGSK